MFNSIFVCLNYIIIKSLYSKTQIKIILNNKQNSFTIYHALQIRFLIYYKESNIE